MLYMMEEWIYVKTENLSTVNLDLVYDTDSALLSI